MSLEVPNRVFFHQYLEAALRFYTLSQINIAKIYTYKTASEEQEKE